MHTLTTQGLRQHGFPIRCWSKPLAKVPLDSTGRVQRSCTKIPDNQEPPVEQLSRHFQVGPKIQNHAKGVLKEANHTPRQRAKVDAREQAGADFPAWTNTP